MIKLRSRLQKAKIVYFRFFSKKHPNSFWYTENKDNEGFNLGDIELWEPLNSSWKQLKKDRKYGT